MTDPWASAPDPWAATASPTPSSAPMEDEDDLLLGTVAGILSELGDERGVAVLIDCKLHTEETRSDLGWEYYDAVLRVPRHLLDSMTDERRQAIQQALTDSAGGERVEYDLVVRPLVQRATSTWREDQARRLDGQRPLNQAKIGRTPIAASEDRLDFRSREELAVFHALKRAQARLKPTDSVGIAPGAGFHTATRNTWEPDFLVTYHGRVGVIEVDGPSHRGSAADDGTRDRILRRSGVAHVERIPVQETRDASYLDRLVDAFLEQLLRSS